MDEQTEDEMADAIRDYLMSNGDALICALQEGIDSSGIHKRMARYIMHRIK